MQRSWGGCGIDRGGCCEGEEGSSARFEDGSGIVLRHDGAPRVSIGRGKGVDFQVPAGGLRECSFSVTGMVYGCGCLE